MKLWLKLLATSFVFVLVGSYGWTHWRHIANAVATPAQEGETEKTYEEVREAQRMVGVAGPLAGYMSRQPQAQGQNQDQPQVETLQPVSRKTVASDHVGGSVVGTGNSILHSTFAVKNTVDLPFEVPPHAATPHLRGTYSSFVKPAGGKGATESSEAANVEFLVLTESQYAEFLSGRDSEAIFSAEDAHDQEVNTGLPPTMNQPAKYYLVFRNSSRQTGPKLVQADFRIDF